MSARRRPWRDCLPHRRNHPWPIGAPARPVDGSQSKEEAFRSQIDPHRCRIEPRQVSSKQISHSHSPCRRLTVGSAFPTRSGRVSDELPRKKRRFAVLREIRHHFARFLQLSFKHRFCMIKPVMEIFIFREKMVAAVLSAGSKPSLVTDLTSENAGVVAWQLSLHLRVMMV
ncbi:calmodulin-binding transcription activator 5 [Actinidia rufa]|uniref:Calmodulin-binding transcription activator 5 n=1 Tax=Actinidia rufa TaxID=165716 RepID=A0A7J0FP40_9ERIC|nr:calmodulin-binding transcription activator 5 [Actinidia rufa]